MGRTLALLLARERLRIALVEQSSCNAAPDIRAYALNSASKQLLESLKVWPGEPLITPVQQMRVRGDAGGEVDFEHPGGALTWIADVPALELQLMQATRYQGQIEVVTEPMPAKLTVICEGKASNPHQTPYPQKAIAARLQSSHAHGGVARQWFKDGDILALLPIEGSASNAFALVWSTATERANQLEKLSNEEFCAALQTVCGLEAGLLNLSSERASWPLSISTAPNWVGEGWALAGDSAHTVHPLSGQGLNLGLGDATELAHVIAQREYWRELGDVKLLRRYERARKANTALISGVTDGLYGLFAQKHTSWQLLRNWGMKGFSRSGPLKTWVTERAMNNKATTL